MKTKSIWGNPPTRIYKIQNLLKNEKGDFTTCIVGCSDGKFLMPFARNKNFVTGYDIDKIALYGGKKLFPIKKDNKKFKYSKDFVSKEFELEETPVMGLVERLDIENCKDYAHIELRDFYKNVPDKQFDLVFTSCSLHYSKNKEFTLQDKVNKLKQITKVGGYLYMDYMMAIEEDDYETYSDMKFFRKGKIKKYFDDNWEILKLTENNSPTFEGAHVDCVKDHFHRFGYLLARRVK